MDVLGNGQEKPEIESALSKAYVTDEQMQLGSLKEAYYQWVSRLIMLFCIISLLFFASASLVLFRMAPQVTVEPFLIIKQDNSATMVRYEVIAQDMPSSKQMMETFIRQYVMLRNTVLNDEREMQSRWFPGGMVNYMSAPRVFNAFKKENADQLGKIIGSKMIRDAEIISIGKVGGEKSPVWKVDFRTYDLSKSSTSKEPLVLKTRYWTASITAFFVPERMFMGRRLMNPLGFTVTRYSQTEVEIL